MWLYYKKVFMPVTNNKSKKHKIKSNPRKTRKMSGGNLPDSVQNQINKLLNIENALSNNLKNPKKTESNKDSRETSTTNNSTPGTPTPVMPTIKPKQKVTKTLFDKLKQIHERSTTKDESDSIKARKANLYKEVADFYVSNLCNTSESDSTTDGSEAKTCNLDNDPENVANRQEKIHKLIRSLENPKFITFVQQQAKKNKVVLMSDDAKKKSVNLTLDETRRLTVEILRKLNTKNFIGLDEIWYRMFPRTYDVDFSNFGTLPDTIQKQTTIHLNAYGSEFQTETEKDEKIRLGRIIPTMKTTYPNGDGFSGMMLDVESWLAMFSNASDSSRRKGMDDSKWNKTIEYGENRLYPNRPGNGNTDGAEGEEEKNEVKEEKEKEEIEQLNMQKEDEENEDNSNNYCGDKIPESTELRPSLGKEKKDELWCKSSSPYLCGKNTNAYKEFGPVCRKTEHHCNRKGLPPPIHRKDGVIYTYDEKGSYTPQFYKEDISSKGKGESNITTCLKKGESKEKKEKKEQKDSRLLQSHESRTIIPKKKEKEEEKEKKKEKKKNEKEKIKHIKKISNNKQIWKITYESGDVYEGKFLNGMKHGEGKMTYANGDKYEGEWKDGKKNGDGTYIYANGDIVKGKWKNGKMNGDGTYIYANGDIVKGKWKNGELTDVI